MDTLTNTTDPGVNDLENTFPDGYFNVVKWRYAFPITEENSRKEIIIDGKKIKISAESFEELKKSLGVE